MVAVNKLRAMAMRTEVEGIEVNERTQCAHYHSDRDIVAIRFKCCDRYYACIRCHEELAGHGVELWGRHERNAPAILCGACHGALSIAEYLGCGNACPKCGAGFNPGCARHYHLYFEV
jgi:uncharacterized CHY-type Zn-finger protein